MTRKKQVEEDADAVEGTEVAQATGSTELSETNWEQEMAKYAQETARDERPSSSTISLRAGMISYAGQPMPDNKLKCIIVAHCNEHSLYTTDFDADNPSNPDCFSLAVDADGMVPHPNSKNMQGGPDGTCATCPMLKWGSSLKGGRGKACQERRRLIVIPAAAATPDDILAAEVAMMKLPVMSVSNWGAYVNTIAAMFKRPPFGMITTISTKPDPKSQFRVTFHPDEPLPFELVDAVMKKREMVQSILLKPYEHDDEAPAAEPKGNTKY